MLNISVRILYDGVRYTYRLTGSGMTGRIVFVERRVSPSADLRHTMREEEGGSPHARRASATTGTHDANGDLR